MGERRAPRLLLVTGMSGAGKSTVLDALEDMGWEVVYSGTSSAKATSARLRSASAWTFEAAASMRKDCPS
jgi:dephospho-CoA kinase